MRTPASFVHRHLALASFGAALSCGCGGEAKKTGSDSGGSNGAGSGNAGTSGSSSGGSSSTTGGDGSGGASGASSGGSNASGGSGDDGGTSPMTGGASTGGASMGGDAGTPSTGGGAGSPSGGNGGNGAGGGGGKSSTGCNSAQVPASGRFTINVSGTMREYILKLPADYDVTRPVPRRLIFAFHGRMYDAQSVADGGPPGSGPYYGIEALAGGSAIFVAPQALSTSWTNEGGRDVAYVNAMLLYFRSSLCIDETRIFSVGFSMGAIMTLTVACSPDSVFRAIAPMSASLPSPCTNNQPLAYWGSHGLDDMTIRPVQGEAVRDAFVTRNGCSTTTMPGDRAGCVNYQGCDAGAPVTWCTFTGVHEPPPYAGAAIWAFLSQF